MGNFKKIRGTEAWMNFIIHEKALDARKDFDTMSAYVAHIAHLGKYPNPNAKVPAIEGAVRMLIKNGSLKPFAKQRRVNEGKSSVVKKEESTMLDLLLEVVELHTHSNKVMKLLLAQVEELSKKVAALFGNHKEIEEAKKRIAAALKEVGEMDGGSLWENEN